MALATLLMWPFSSLLRGLPYLVAVAWIITAALYDVNIVLQQSLFIVVYFYLTNGLERLLLNWIGHGDNSNTSLVLFSSFINSSALAVLVIGYLFGLSPLGSSNSGPLTSIATTGYALLLQLLEPVVMFIETVQVIRLIFSVGDWLREKVHEEDDEKSSATLYKGIIILGTTLNYGLSLAGTIYLIRQESHLFAL